jgi:hypothetical protein
VLLLLPFRQLSAAATSLQIGPCKPFLPFDCCLVSSSLIGGDLSDHSHLRRTESQSEVYEVQVTFFDHSPPTDVSSVDDCKEDCEGRFTRRQAPACPDAVFDAPSENWNQLWPPALGSVVVVRNTGSLFLQKAAATDAKLHMPVCSKGLLIVGIKLVEKGEKEAHDGSSPW